MPLIDIGNARLNYELEGEEGAPALILSNSLGTTLQMWAPQMPTFLRHFRVLRYDTRGHGNSDVTPGPYSMAQLGADVVALMDRLGIARAHFCGLSMGGMIGMWLGANRPSRIDRLVLSNTAARIGTPEMWNARIDKIMNEGMAAIVPALVDRWFSAEFQQRAPKEVDIVRAMLLDNSLAGYAANCVAVRDMDQRDQVARIAVPTLVIAGTYDLASPPEDGKWLSQQIRGAQYAELPACHLSNWEAAQSYTEQVVRFLTA